MFCFMFAFGDPDTNLLGNYFSILLTPLGRNTGFLKLWGLSSFGGQGPRIAVSQVLILLAGYFKTRLKEFSFISFRCGTGSAS